MRGRELFLSSLQKQPAKLPPVFLRDLTLCLDESGHSTPEVCAGDYDGRKSALSVLALHRRLGQDAVVGCVHNMGIGIESLGGEVSFPEHGIPSIIRHPFEEIPSALPEPSAGGQTPQIAESYRRVGEGLGDKAALVLNSEGPVTRAALLRGIENLLLDMEIQPDLAAELMEFSLQSGLLYMEEIHAKSSPDCSFIAAATDNPDILGTERTMMHSMPGLKALTRKASDLGMPTVFHPHGDFSDPRNSPLLDASLECGISGFQFAEDNDPRRIRELLRGRTCVLGGIDAFSTLLFGPEERIARESREFLEMFQDFPGYVFMCSCSIHRGMPLSHVDALMGSLR